MNIETIAAAFVAALIVSAGAAGAIAAAPGNAPDDAGSQADDRADDGEHGNESAADDHRDVRPVNGSDGANASAADDRQGPRVDLPQPVPDHVGQVHQRVVDFLGGGIDHLGDAVSGVVANDENPADDDGDETATPTPTSTPTATTT